MTPSSSPSFADPSKTTPMQWKRYLRTKHRLWSQDQKQRASQAHAAAISRKEKIKALERERRARLQLEKGKSATSQRPEWDSSIFVPTSDVDGPWSSIPDINAVDFPLPKPQDSDSSISLWLGSPRSLAGDEEPSDEKGNISENSIQLEQKPCLGNNNLAVFVIPSKDAYGRVSNSNRKHNDSHYNETSTRSVSSEKFCELVSNGPVSQEKSKCHLERCNVSDTRSCLAVNSLGKSLKYAKDEGGLPKKQKHLAKCVDQSELSQRRGFRKFTKHTCVTHQDGKTQKEPVSFSASHIANRSKCFKAGHNGKDRNQSELLSRTISRCRKLIHMHQNVRVANKCMHLSGHDAMVGCSSYYPTKRKADTFKLHDQNLRMPGKRHQKVAMSTSTYNFNTEQVISENGRHILNQGERIKKPLLEAVVTTQKDKQDFAKAPYDHTREAISERKWVTLLKILAQQLVSRLDAAQMFLKHRTSTVYDENHQYLAHAVSMKRTFNKFQKKLSTLERALDDVPSQALNKSGCYIVLPTKMNLNRNAGLISRMKQTRGSEDLAKSMKEHMQINEAAGKQFAESPNPFNDVDMTTSTSMPMMPCSPSLKSVCGILHAEKQDTHNTTEEAGDGIEPTEILKQELDTITKPFEMDKLNPEVGWHCYKWDQHFLDRELRRLDAEIKKTKSRMAQKLILSHPHQGEVNSTPSVPNHLDHVDDDQSVSFQPITMEGRDIQDPFRGTPDVKIEMKNIINEDLKGKGNVDVLVNELPLTEDYCAKSPSFAEIGTEVLNKECKVLAEPNRGVECGLFTTNDTREYAALSSKTAGNESAILTTPQAITNGDISESASTKSSLCLSSPNVMPVNSRWMASSSPDSLNVDIRRTHEVFVNIMTDTLMQELLEEILSEIVVYVQTSHQSPHCGRSMAFRTEFNESTDIDGSSPDHSNFTCKVLCTENSETEHDSPQHRGMRLVLNDDVSDGVLSPCVFKDAMVAKCSNMEKVTDRSYMEPFKSTSKRLVEKYVNDLEGYGVLDSMRLLELYAFDGSISSVLQINTDLVSNLEDHIHGKLLFHAICECLEKHFSQFTLPAFLLLLRPCVAGQQLKQVLISKVIEHADAACEGGFSLEYILQKSLDEEDWKKPFNEMLEIVTEISEGILVDVVEDFIMDISNNSQLRVDAWPATTCSLQLIESC